MKANKQKNKRKILYLRNNEQNDPIDCALMFQKSPAGNRRQHRVSTNPVTIKNKSESV